jgi:hypothetical protein
MSAMNPAARAISGIWRRRYASIGFNGTPRLNAASSPEKPDRDTLRPTIESKKASAGKVRAAVKAALR